MTRISIDVINFSTRRDGGSLLTVGVWKWELRLMNVNIWDEEDERT
ncbi:hypothetical protein HVTV-2_gp55 [Haloarcula virus HVTV-2]|uniref:Uncharacterized protein n=1 Tax=Haloarcula vallismortis tailed virus 1 TaxID=1262528 RepID=L7TKB6_9CAUD|nr:hypothetical protein HVTV1_56 [Haloarcula vallismortis tailed virus 1]AGC34425.1 hypothetical protein HVTV1_56 [Haloarcula vallismortis tailed virus 1]UBF22862.1 hypothetical protein HVTV-2_gp55 [Haloarcula virus HVTV-2]